MIELRKITFKIFLSAKHWIYFNANYKITYLFEFDGQNL